MMLVGMGVSSCAAATPRPVPDAIPRAARPSPRASSPGLPVAAPKARCLDELLARGVAFVPLRHSRGVALPVQIEGPVAGVSYRPTAGFELVVDCRFALVLASVGPILRRHGVSALEFSIAHRYRQTRYGRLSLHANGLALDVHRAIFDDGEQLSVRRDFSRRRGAYGCSAPSKPMNALACDLKHTGWFSELLTPDDDADHADHFHLGVARTPAPN